MLIKDFVELFDKGLEVIIVAPYDEQPIEDFQGLWDEIPLYLNQCKVSSVEPALIVKHDGSIIATVKIYTF